MRSLFSDLSFFGTRCLLARLLLVHRLTSSVSFFKLLGDLDHVLLVRLGWLLFLLIFAKLDRLVRVLRFLRLFLLEKVCVLLVSRLGLVGEQIVAFGPELLYLGLFANFILFGLLHKGGLFLL